MKLGHPKELSKKAAHRAKRMEQGYQLYTP